MVRATEDVGDRRISITKGGIVLSGYKAGLAIVRNNPCQVELVEDRSLIETNK